MIEVVVVGLHLRWYGVWQRPNHVLSRLAARAAIVVVEEESAAGADAVRIERIGNIVVMTPERRHPQPGVDRATIAEVRALVACRPALLWLYSPLMADLADAVPGEPVVYDKMDELALFRYAEPSLAQRERQVCASAAYVFAGGRSLWESVESRVRAGAAFPSGVEVDAYAAAAARRNRDDPSRRSRKPVFGYIGVIDERIDLDLIESIARERRDASVVLIGPLAKIEPGALPRASNLRYLGKREYAELPTLVAGFDVALMPFARNDATRYISPTKTLEYLAARRPVVSTAVPDVVADFGDIVYVANDTTEFIAALTLAEASDAVRAEAGVARAAAMTWDAVVQRMLDALAGVGITFGAGATAAGPIA